MIFQAGFSIADIPLLFTKMLGKIVLAILIFLIGFVVGKFAERFLIKILKEVELNKIIKQTTGFRVNLEQILSHTFSYMIYFLAIVAALDQIGLANIVLYLLTGAVILIIIVSFFLAIRDFLPNLISGFYLYKKDGLKEGLKVEIDDVKGTIIKLDLLQIKIETKKGEILYLPNSMVAKSKITIKKRL